MTPGLRLLRALGGGLALLVLLALADVLPPGANWYAGHPMTAAAVSTLVGFLAIGLLVESWIKEREAAQLRRISTVAYRSLAQYANDAGRALLAPLVGADLFALSIPEASRGDAVVVRERLTNQGLPITFDAATGSWRGIVAASHDFTLRALTSDRDFVREMFRITATMRRRLQEATALWAPVMLTSRWSSDDLGRLRDLSDAFELLQEHWRLSGIIGHETGDWQPESVWQDALSYQFWATVACYEEIRDEFAELAALPSDAIVRRRA